MEGVFLVQHPVEIELHRLGIERRAVMECHALAKMEHIFQPVIRDIPAFGKRWLHLERAVGITHQPVIDIDHDTEIIGRGHGSRIKRFRLGDLPDEQDTRRCLRSGRQRQTGAYSRGCGHCQHRTAGE